MQRAHKTRIYPNDRQCSYLVACCGAARFAYNKCLEQWERDYRAGDGVSHNYYSIKKWFNGVKGELFPWTYQYPKSIYDAAIQNLADGYDAFFSGQRNHPRFHKKGRRDSFRIDGDRIKFDGKYMTLPGASGLKLPERFRTIKMAEPLRYDATKIYNVTVSQRAGMWFVSICCEVEDVPNESHNAVGIDLGVKELATLSDGTVVHNPKLYRKRERRMKHLQREVSRKQKGSANRRKAKLRLARYQYRTACMRQDYIHKATTEIANQYGIVFMEDLNVGGMTKSHHLAKSIQDASFSEFARQLSYKASVFKVDRFFPSSQLCSGCGRRQKMPLDVRTYECPNCGLEIDRDLNAAINIRNVGAVCSEFMPVEGVDAPSWCYDWVAERPAKQESTSNPAQDCVRIERQVRHA